VPEIWGSGGRPSTAARLSVGAVMQPAVRGGGARITVAPLTRRESPKDASPRPGWAVECSCSAARSTGDLGTCRQQSRWLARDLPLAVYGPGTHLA
jgi:hypothetical protein